MIRKYAEIFCWKNVSSFCSAKATHIFSAKYIRILCIESAKTVNEMTLNELVKLTTLWTTGPRELLWNKLIYRFGFEVFITFIALPVDRQLNGLFSGCQNILSEVQDVIDCLKIFVMSLYKIYQSAEPSVLSHLCRMDSTTLGLRTGPIPK